jgi:hypothetical protein
MFIRVYDRRTRYAAFFLLMLSINVIDGMLVRSVADPGRRMVVAAAASVDVVALVSLLYYWMLVRPGIRAPGSVVAVVLIGVLHATYFYSNARAARAIVAGLCEAGLIGFVVAQVRRKTRREMGSEENADPVATLSAALEGVIMVPGAAKLLTAEMSILYYALFSWRAKPSVASDARAFSIHKQVGHADLLGALAIPCALEILPVHLILKHWSPALAWIATGLSMYGMIWLIGLARAFALRPVLVGQDYLDLRYGLLFRLRVPREMIARVRRAEASDVISAVPRRSAPNICIELVQSMNADGPFGIRKRVNRVAVTADEENAFELALAELMGTE